MIFSPKNRKGIMYLGIDFETQGFNAETDAPTELGLVAFNDEFEELYSLNFLIKSPLTKPQPQVIVDITGITDEMIAEDGEPEVEVFNTIYQRVKEAKAIFAYNAPFDTSFLKALFKRNSIDEALPLVVDVMRDIEYPEKFKCKKLSHLAYDHGILEHPDNLHRAINDVRLMIKLLAKYDLEKVIANAGEKKFTLRIKIPPPWEDKQGNEYAKSNGYRFVPETKFWCKEVRESQIEAIQKASIYPTERLK